MLTICTNIEIDCPIKQVWQVLMDFDSYSKWNSFIKSIEVLNKKPIQPNSQMHVTLNQQAGKTISFSPVVTHYEPYQSLHWLGKFFVKGIFDGRHQFVLAPSKHYANGTLFIHKETFTGILVPFFKRTLNNNTKMRFEEMKKALTTLQQATIKEAGCHLFSVHQDKSDSSKVILWECFEDEEAFEYHFTLQHTKDYFALNITEVVQAVKSDLIA